MLLNMRWWFQNSVPATHSRVLRHHVQDRRDQGGGRRLWGLRETHHDLCGQWIHKPQQNCPLAPRDCYAESNYVVSKNAQNYLGSNCDLLVSYIQRGENFIHIMPLL